MGNSSPSSSILERTEKLGRNKRSYINYVLLFYSHECVLIDSNGNKNKSETFTVLKLKMQLHREGNFNFSLAHLSKFIQNERDAN